MAIIKKKDLHSMAPEALDAKLFEVRRELNHERGMVASGGRAQNPGKIRELRKTVARILTLLSRKKSRGQSDKTPKSASISAGKSAGGKTQSVPAKK
ncbi:MAG: 50S ribosomal protein L29 [Candidatus Micrarchaeia archaeon]